MKPAVFVRYNDIWLRVIASVLAAHFIVMYGVQESLFEVLLRPIYYIAMLGSTIIAFTLMCFVRVVSMRLDRKFDWIDKTTERSGLQILFGIVLPSLIAFVMAGIYFGIRGLNILKTPYLRFDYPLILTLILVLNLYYLAYYFYARMLIAERSLQNIPIAENDSEGNSKKIFLVNQGARNIPVPFDEIAYFFRDGDYNFLRTRTGNDYSIVQSLDEVQQYLNEIDFFRANRQMLTSRNACKHFETLPYNKLELFVKPEYKSPIVISQKRSRSFRDWITD